MATVLVIEDSLTDAERITQFLKQLGLMVISTRSAEEAQSQLQSQKPDLVILDVILPGQSGFEICRELKSDPATQGIPVVICSTKDTDADKMWGNMLGADAYLGKPVDQAEVQQVVQRLIRT